MVEAYRYYSMSLTAASDADRIAMLRRSIELDESFHYSVENLRALERRLQDYRRRQLDLVAQRTDRSLNAILNDELSPEQRVEFAQNLLHDHFASRRFQTLAETARILFELDIDPTPSGDIRELSSRYLFVAYASLQETNLALQAGETYLQMFPAHQNTSHVRLRLGLLVNREEVRREARAEAEQELREIEDRERALQSIGNPHSRLFQEKVLAHQRCRLLRAVGRYDEAHDACDLFLNTYLGSDEPFVEAVILHKLLIFSDQREFEQGRAWAETALATDPPDKIRHLILGTIRWWPEE